MYISLYRRYRPQTFSDVVGQSAAIGVISRAVKNGTPGHAYLFSGPRGCGKTTIARLFAKALNCTQKKDFEPCNECDVCRSITDGTCLDVIEIDGASNNTVDEIRDLKDRVALASFSCPYKVYIIDEVHMLSISAFNALLKTLEEPPERVIFILATTDPHKVPVTIRSRCQHIPFHGMTVDQIVERLRQISGAEKIRFEEEALWEIARNSDGGMRDALSLMEQAIAFSDGAVSREAVDKLLGGGSAASIRQWLSLCHASPEAALPSLEELFRSGAEPERFVSTLFICFRNLWLQLRWGAQIVKKLSLSSEERQWLEQEKNFLEQPRLERLMAQTVSLLPQIRRGLTEDVLTGLLVGWLFAEDFSSGADSESGSGTIENCPRRNPFAAQAEAPREKMSDRLLARGASQIRSVSSAAPRQAEPLPEMAPQSAVDSGEGEIPNAQTSAPQSLHKGQSELCMKIAAEAVPSPSSEALKNALREKLPGEPLLAAALLMADIYRDTEKQELYLIYEPAQQLAWKSLENVREVMKIPRLLGDEELRKVVLISGNEEKRYDFPQGKTGEVLSGRTEFFEDPVEKDAEKAPAEAEGIPRQKTLERLTQHHGEGGSARPAGTLSENLSDGVEGKARSLTEILQNFTEGELLYCRPNDNSEGEDESEDE